MKDSSSDGRLLMHYFNSDTALTYLAKPVKLSKREFGKFLINAVHRPIIYSNLVFIKYCFLNEPAVSSVAKHTLSVREVWGSIPGPVKSSQCRQRFATVATILRSCVAQALSRGDGPGNSLHASA